MRSFVGSGFVEGLGPDGAVVGEGFGGIVGITEDAYKNAIYHRELPAENTLADNPPA